MKKTPALKNNEPTRFEKTRTSQTNVLVAGGAGFIGSQLCQALLEHSQVFCLDNFVKGEQENLKPLFDNDNFVFIKHDLKRKLPSDLPKADYIFHVAGINGYPLDEKMLLETLLVNSLGTQQLLERAKKHRAKFLLLSSFRIYEGTISKETLKDYFGESKLAQTRFSHREAKRFSENLCFEYFKKENLDLRIVRIADVYGPTMPLDSEEELSLIFSGLKREGILKIKGGGEQALYPTFISDVIQGLLKAMFVENTRGKIFTLVNPYKKSLNEVVHTVQEIITDGQQRTKVKIEYLPEEVKNSFFVPETEILKSQNELGWRPQVSLEEGIRKTLDWLGPNILLRERLGVVSARKETAAKIPKNKKRKKFKIKLPEIKLNLKQNFFFLILPLVFLLISLLPFLFFVTQTTFGGIKLKRAAADFQEGKLTSSYQQASGAAYHFQKSRNILLKFGFLLQPISAKGVNRADELLLFGYNLGEILKEACVVLDKQQELLTLVLKGESGHPQETYTDLRLGLDQLSEKLALAQAQLDSQLSPLFSLNVFSLGKRLETIAGQLPQRRKEVEEARELMVYLPEILSFQEKKTYLLIFQNNMELRPTGGFIGSYGLLIFDKGRLLDFEVQDIYVADGQLKGHVEPPEEIKKYLGEANWYFRDANWDPDWTKTAPRLSWFLEKEMNRQVDGVIGLNLFAAQAILKVIGSISLPDYQETITADNLFERAEYYAEVDSFPGSTQKKDFLGKLSYQLMMTIKDLEPDKFIKLGETGKQLLNQKQLAFYFEDKRLAQFFREKFWDGSLRQIDARAREKGLQDYLMLVEANLGVNKANFFIKRAVTHQLKLDRDLKIQAETMIVYENNSPGENWPGGIYKNYLRAYLPQDVKEIRILLKEREGEEYKAVDSAKIKIESEGDKKVAGFYFEVPVKEQTKVRLLYSLGTLPVKNNQGILVFYFQKQAGIGADPLAFQVEYPAFLLPLKTEPATPLSLQNLLFETNQEKDQLFTVYFYKR